MPQLTSSQRSSDQRKRKNTFWNFDPNKNRSRNEPGLKLQIPSSSFKARAQVLCAWAQSSSARAHPMKARTLKYYILPAELKTVKQTLSYNYAYEDPSSPRVLGLKGTLEPGSLLLRSLEAATSRAKWFSDIVVWQHSSSTAAWWYSGIVA